jgi:hypothetical protein
VIGFDYVGQRLNVAAVVDAVACANVVDLVAERVAYAVEDAVDVGVMKLLITEMLFFTQL